MKTSSFTPILEAAHTRLVAAALEARLTRPRSAAELTVAAAEPSH